MSRARLENLKSAADEMKSGRTWDTTPLNPPPADAAPEDTGVPPGGEAVGGFFHQPVKRLSSAVPAVRSLDERPNPRNISGEPSAKTGSAGRRDVQRVTANWHSTTIAALVARMKPYCRSTTPKFSLA